MNIDRQYQIVDLDGCISDDRWRRSFINIEKMTPRDPEWNKRFHAYHEGSFFDPVMNLHHIVYEDIIILTGRPVRYQRMTMDWLHRVAKIHPLHVIFRNNDDVRPSVELKRMMMLQLFDYNSYGLAQEEIALAIDDREDIVEMYAKEFGVPSRVVRIGEEEHHHG